MPSFASIGAKCKSCPSRSSFDSGLVRKLSYLVMPPPSSATREFVLAIDFGGTKIALGTADSDGRILESARLDTEAARGAGQAVERALQVAHELMARTAGHCIGVAAVTPGVVRPDRVLLA